MQTRENPSEELIKEVYALFGLAYYFSECLHRELCHILTYSTFESKTHITAPRVEEKLSFAYSLTLGQLKDKLKNLLPKHLYSELDPVLEKRNYLAHHFWFERVHLMYSDVGLEELINELLTLQDLFERTDLALSEYSKPLYEKFGLSKSILEKSLNEVKTGKRLTLHNHRKVKKTEYIVRIWNVKTNNKSVSLIFETEDGCLWQLCDVGLGWSYYEIIGIDWKVNKRFQQFLPANIISKPKNKKPWHYEFALANGAKFWVRPGKNKNTFVWGIKTK